MYVLGIKRTTKKILNFIIVLLVMVVGVRNWKQFFVYCRLDPMSNDIGSSGNQGFTMEEERQKYRTREGEAEPCDPLSPRSIPWKGLEAKLPGSGVHVSCPDVSF